MRLVQPVRPVQPERPVRLERLAQTDKKTGRILIALSGLGDQKRGRECNLPFFYLADRSVNLYLFGRRSPAP